MILINHEHPLKVSKFYNFNNILWCTLQLFKYNILTNKLFDFITLFCLLVYKISRWLGVNNYLIIKCLKLYVKHELWII